MGLPVDNTMQVYTEACIRAYMAIQVSSLQMKAARGRLQPWQASQAFTKMVGEIEDMHIKATAQNGSNGIDTILEAVEAKLNQKFGISPSSSAPIESDVTSRITQLETLTNDNNKIIARILEKVGD